jgi:ketosteroid isomerase-like protein
MPEPHPVTPGAAAQLVERYLRAVAGQDWASVEACLSRSVVRDGPFGDDFEGLEDYMGFLRRTMPSLPGYEMDIDRVTEMGDGRVFVELRETVEMDGKPLVTDECLVFVLDDRINRVSIYIRHAPVRPAARAVGSAT